MVVLGYENTLPVTMDVMIHHSKAVVRGTEHAMIVGDMPFMTYHISIEDAMRNAARFIQEAGVQAVKLEGGVTVADKVKRIVDCGIPVMGHIGMTPQSVNQFGGHLVQGKKLEVAQKLNRRCESAGTSRSIFYRAGMYPGTSGGFDYAKCQHSHHWYRGRSGM